MQLAQFAEVAGDPDKIFLGELLSRKMTTR